MGAWKKRKIQLVLALGVAALGIYLYFDLRDFLGLTTLSLKAAESAWGNKEFSQDNFRNGSLTERASQVVSLLRSHRYIGKPLQTVVSELGPQDSYYNSDEIPAYSLPELKGATYQLVFLPNESGTIEEIIIRKDCCYRGFLNIFIR